MDAEIAKHAPRRGVAMFVVLTVIVVITMLGFMGLSLARHDVLGSGDLIDARSMENAAYAGQNLAVARLEVDPTHAALELAKFIADSTAASPRQWLNFTPASGKSFELVSTKPAKYSIKGATGTNSSVQVRIISMDVGNAGGVPTDGMKLTLQAVGTGRSGEEVSTIASYRILGLDVQRIAVITSTGRPTHALYLGGNLDNANGNLKTDGSVYISGNYNGNNGYMTIKGKLKIGGNMDLPSGNPQTIDSNTWIGGYLNVNSGNRLHYKRNLGVGGGLCKMNDSLVVDSSLNIYGTCPTGLDWQSEKKIRVNGRQFFLRDQVLGTQFINTYWAAWLGKWVSDTTITALRKGPLHIKKGTAFLWTGLHSWDADPAAYPSDSIKFLQLGRTDPDCGGIKSYAGRGIWVDSAYIRSVCNLSMRTSGQSLRAIGSARIGRMTAGTINISGKGWAPGTSYLPSAPAPVASGGWTYAPSPDNIVLPKAPQGLIQLGMDSLDTMATIAQNPPNTISLSAALVGKIQKLSTYKVKAGVTAANMAETGTGRYINKMLDTAGVYGDLFGGYLVLLIDEATAIRYANSTDLIKGKIMFIIDNSVTCGFAWPASLNSSAIQILYVPKAQTVHGTTFTGNGGFASGEIGIHYGNFYGFIYSEKLLNLKAKFDTELRGAIMLTVAGSSIEFQTAADATTNGGELEIILDQLVFNDINTYLGVIKDPAGKASEPTIVVSLKDGLVARQSRLQCVPLGVYR